MSTPVATRLQQFTVDVLLAYSMFYLVDAYNNDIQGPFTDDILQPKDIGGAMLGGVHGDHTDIVTVEAWSGPPPPVEGWERTEEKNVDFPSGEAQIWQLFSGPVGPPVHLTPGTCRVRASVRGQAELMRVFAENDTEEATRGVEQWMIQIW